MTQQLWVTQGRTDRLHALMTHILTRPPTAVISFIAVSLTLSACSVGNVHNSKSIKNINSQSQAQEAVRVGMTMSEVISSLGEPTTRNTYNGRTIWGYQNNQLTINKSSKVVALALGGVVLPDTKSVLVHFNEQSLVERVDFNQQTF